MQSGKGEVAVASVPGVENATMHTRIAEVLEGRSDNHLLPFFWQHGEDEARLREEMARIHESAIGAVCVESRPHPDFCGPRWWADMDIIMDEARRRDMRVWLLDDAHFPTGFANGWIRDKFPALRKIYLAQRHMDAVGPQAGASLPVDGWVKSEELLLAAVAVPLTPEGAVRDDAPPVNLTARVADGRLPWDIPPGHWRVFFVVETPNGGGKPSYLNPIDPASCRVLIDAVYEPHYARYAADFGGTFAGFFSDEPNIGNGAGLYDCAIGRKRMVLPWRAGLLEALSAEFGSDVACHLPGLWHDIGATTWSIRQAYMQLVSRLYGQCFTDQIGAWCTDHGVDYIGHIIEDNDAHTRLGASVPHFFRALGGQTMSGIDVVLWQVRPGMDRRSFAWPIESDPADGEFFHYELAKLGASHAHIDPRKQGRAMCEIYGAYGWAEGLRLMKWLTDHMLVRGINRFVPHAFSPRDFPDGDCPPHFYARGKNPQYRHLRLLMEYTNRVCHLLDGGRHVAEAAVLYHAEAEWSGACMSAKEPMRVLMQAQLDADIVPADALASAIDSVGEGRLRIHQETYGCLILPWAERWPRMVMKTLVSLLEQGVKIVCVRDWPEGTTEDGSDGQELVALRRHANACVTELERLPELLATWGLTGARTATREPYLRRYEYRHGDLAVWMFFNEDPWQTIRTSVYLDGAERVVAYDPFANRLEAVAGRREDAGLRVNLALSPDESVILLAGDVPPASPAGRWSDADRAVPLHIPVWQVSTATAETYPEFSHWRNLEALCNLCQPGLLPDFSGIVRYEADFDFDGPAGGCAFLDLGDVGEVAEVWLNEIPLGVRICRPYVLDATDALRCGKNALRVEATNTLACAMRDELSRFAPHDPTGLIGPVQLHLSGCGNGD